LGSLVHSLFLIYFGHHIFYQTLNIICIVGLLQEYWYPCFKFFITDDVSVPLSLNDYIVKCSSRLYVGGFVDLAIDHSLEYYWWIVKERVKNELQWKFYSLKWQVKWMIKLARW